MKQETIKGLWMVVSINAHYRATIRPGFPNEMAAKEYIDKLVGRQGKQHGQDYEALPDTPATRSELKRRCPPELLIL